MSTFLARRLAALSTFLYRAQGRALAAGFDCGDAGPTRAPRSALVDGERAGRRARDECDLDGFAGRVVRTARRPRAAIRDEFSGARGRGADAWRGAACTYLPRRASAVAEARSVWSSGAGGVLRRKPVCSPGQQSDAQLGRGERACYGSGSEPHALGRAGAGDSAGIRRVTRGAGGDARVLERVRRAAHDLRRLRAGPARMFSAHVGVATRRG